MKLIKLLLIVSLIIASGSIKAEIIPIKSQEELQAWVEKKDYVILVGVNSECPVCQSIKKPLGQVSESMPTVTFLQIDIEHCQTICDKYGITIIPTFIFFAHHKQEPIEIIKGLTPKMNDHFATEFSDRANDIFNKSH